MLHAHACDPQCPWCPRGLTAPALGAYDHRAPLGLRRHHRAAIEADVGPFVIVDFPHAGRTQVWAMLDAAKLDDGHSEWGPDMHALAAEWGAEVGERREWPDGREYWTTRNVLTAETRMGSMPYSEPLRADTALAAAPVPAALLALRTRRDALSLAVERLGWSLDDLDLDFARGVAKAWFVRGARRVFLHVHPRGASFERWARYTRPHKALKGDLWWDEADDRFLGRVSARDGRALLGDLAAYLVANGAAPELPAPDLAAMLAAASSTEVPR